MGCHLDFGERIFENSITSMEPSGSGRKLIRLRSFGQMSIERAEKLKELLTDQFVVVDATVPELRRFENWTGKVRTVNMNCRALVEFDGPVDIGWYDIDPDYLKVVDAPVKRVAPPAAAKPAAAAKPVAPEAKAVAKPAAKPAASAGKSPLDAIRAQQAAKAPGATTDAPAAKPSPLDMIRKQQAAKAPGATTDAPAAKLSPLDMIRKQQASKAAAVPEVVAPPAQVAAAEVVSEPVAPTPAAPVAAAAKPVSLTGEDGKPLSKLEMIRRQGAAKK
jgi:hypothetical protein